MINRILPRPSSIISVAQVMSMRNSLDVNARIALVRPPLSAASRFCTSGEDRWRSYASLSRSYHLGRQKHTPLAFDLLKQHVGLDAACLDVGCGTGISTRQLVEAGFRQVTGCDKEPQMLAYATQKGGADYVQADVSCGMPFPDAQFDLVTAFSAIHWFAEKASIAELVRVLKPGGHMFTVGDGAEPPDATGVSFRAAAVAMIRRAVGNPLPEKRVEPSALLEAGGLQVKVCSQLPYQRVFTREQALAFIQSLSYWNFIQGTPHEEQVIAQLKAYIDRRSHHDLIRLDEAITVVLAQKP